MEMSIENITRKFVAATAFAVAGFIAVMYFITIDSTNIPEEFVDSIADKVFYATMMLGIAGFLSVFGWGVLTKEDQKETKSKMFLILLVATSVSFVLGVYYHFVFGSPL